MPRRHWRLRVADMLDAAVTAVSLANGLKRAEFLAQRTLVDAAIKNITVLGEAATNVPDAIIERWPDVPWRKMRDMRNLIVHEYFGVSSDVLWGTIRDDLPAVVPQLRRILDSDEPDSQ